ncbi:hypothetical protein A3Q35_13305 [Aeribacillus pallidus]|uniref:hypothetical protein n=1 Tax=Aeribacillus pallidus TaxID=33936 RepID=UPI0007B49A01|nr:hypothetical protein [Aeribacillus pallidus]KZM54929.1 hypothetical protein A3Q35_13305 [Aeribacillus pallidus]
MKSKKFLEDLRKLVIDTDGGKERHYQATLVYLQKNLDALDWLIEQAEKVELLNAEKDLLQAKWEAQGLMIQKLHNQAEKVERYEKSIKECIERMDEGGQGTRSFVYEKLKEVMEGTECMGK